MGFLDKLFRFDQRALKKIEKQSLKVLAYEEEMASKTDDELRAKTAEFKERLNAGVTLEDIKFEAFAVAREAAKRVLNQFPFKVQVMGAIVLNQGDVAEMRTGEGKTLTATMAVYLNALTGKGVHVVTVNEYLAQRDAEWMGQIYRFLGLTVGVNLTVNPCNRRRFKWLNLHLADSLTPTSLHLTQRIKKHRSRRFNLTIQMSVSTSRTILFYVITSSIIGSQQQIANITVYDLLITGKIMRREKRLRLNRGSCLERCKRIQTGLFRQYTI